MGELCSLPVVWPETKIGGGNEDNGDLLQKVPWRHCHSQCPHPAAGHRWPTLLLETSGHSQAKSGSISCGVTAPFSWVLVHTGFVCALQESVSPVLCKFWRLYDGVHGNLLQEGLCHSQVCCTQSPCPCGRPLLTRTTTGDAQIFKGRSGPVSVGFPGVHKVLFEPSEHL